MSVKIRVSHGWLYLDIYWKGSRKWENLHMHLPTDRKEAREAMRLAEIIKAERERQLVVGEYGLKDEIAEKTELVLYAQKLADEQAPKNPLPKSQKYLQKYGDNITLGAIDAQWVEGYRKFLLDQPTLSPATAAKYLAALRGVLHRALRDRLIIRDPTLGSHGISVPEPETVHLTLEEVERLAATALGGEIGAEVKRAFLFGCFSGLRVSDLKSLRWGQIERDPPSIHKRQQKTQALVRIPLHKSAWVIIDDKKIHKADELVFPVLSRNKTNTNQYLTHWAEQAGLEKRLGWHVARRTFGTLALQAGGDLKTVSSLLGHKKITHTARYLKTDSATQRATVEAIPELVKQKAEIIPLKIAKST